MLCPGEVRLTEEGVFGPDTLDYLDRYHADAAFIGAGGFTLAEVSDADASGVAVKRKMITRAGRVVLLADRTKAGVTQYATVCPLDGLDALVTDAPLTDEFAMAMARGNVEVMVAPDETPGEAQ
jgi:DeoR/GlpR family transcriptional regulator of sugar metabolism